MSTEGTLYLLLKMFPIPFQERFSYKGATSGLYSEFDGLLKQN